MRVVAILGVLVVLAGAGIAAAGFFMDVTVASVDMSPCFAGMPCPESTSRIVNQHLVWRSYSMQICGAALALAGVVIATWAWSPRPPPSIG